MDKLTFLKIYNITEQQFCGKTPINGDLDLSSLTSIPEGFNPTVGGYLNLPSLKSIPEGFNPTVGGYLDLYNLTSIPEGFNPTVGGYLYLDSLKSIPEGFNPTVGGSLYLRSLISFKSTYNKLVGPVTWGDKYIKADGMFTEIVHRRGNIFKVKKLNKDKIFYLVTDGNNKWSHGDTLKQAIDDLIYKIKSSDTSEYNNLTLDIEVSFEKGIEMYRTITGACSFGVKDFVKNNNIKNKKYQISEIINITENSYGHKEFKEFFI